MPNDMFGGNNGQGPEQFAQFFKDSNTTIEQKLQVIASMVYPIFQQFTAQGGASQVSIQATTAYLQAQQMLSDQAIDDFMFVLQSMTRQDIEAALAGKVNITTNKNATRQEIIAATTENIKSVQELYRAIPESTFIALSKIGDEIVMPSRLRSAYNKATNGKSAEDSAREVRDYYLNNTAEDIAQKSVGALGNVANPNIATDKILDAIITFKDNLDAQTIKDMRDTFFSSFSEQDCSNLATSGVDFADEFLKAAMAGKPFELQNSQKGTDFAMSVGKVTQAFEDALDKGGLMPAEDKMVSAFKTIKSKFGPSQK